MARDTERSRLFTRRAFLLAGAQAGLFSLLAARIYYLQFVHGDKYATMAEENRISLRLLSPPRGQILDRTGSVLALNQQNYRLVLLPEQVDNLSALLAKIANHVPLTDFDRKRVERDWKKRGGFNTVLVRDNLTWDQVAALSLNTLDISGAEIESGEVRSYPFGDSLSHILGYVGIASSSEVNEEEPELTIPGFRLGKSGIEKQYDKELRGLTGAVQLEVNARGRVVRELDRKEPQQGKDVVLTIDNALQNFTKQRVAGEESASVVVMDVHTGAVYALVSHPGFDPNLFAYGITQKDWDSLNNDEHTPLLNKVSAGVYAPGSTFKVVTALAALEAGLLDPSAKVFCPGHLELGKHRFHCWKRGGHGYVDFIHAMAGSCDTYFYDLGRKIGIDKIEAMARRLGMGEKTGIDLPHERSGLVPGRVWKTATRNAGWQQGETLITAIGQGYLLASPLQLVQMTARIVNGGKAVVPHLVQGPAMEFPSLGFRPKNLKLVQEAMAAVVMQNIGTAHGAAIADETMAMGGKTGTAQVRRISMRERADGVLGNDELPWRERDHALFIGFAPVGNPRYAVAVVIDHGGSGAHIAAPIARDVLLECQKRNVAGV